MQVLGPTHVFLKDNEALPRLRAIDEASSGTNYPKFNTGTP